MAEPKETEVTTTAPAPAEEPAAAPATAAVAQTRARRQTRPKYVPKRKVCPFCRDKVQVIEYKNISLLRNYITDRAKISPRRKTGVCAKHQRALAVAIKRARHLALLPFVPAHIYKTGGVGIKE